MEIQGQVTQVCQPQRFQTKNGENTKYGFVIRTNERYQKNIHFTIIGDDKWQKMAVQPNEVVTVSFDISSREWNGRWFTQCEPWKVFHGQSAPQPQYQQPQQQYTQPIPPTYVQPSAMPQTPQPTSDENLPF